MPSPFENSLSAAVNLLRTIPGNRQERAVARSLFDAFRKAYPEPPARLVVNYRPGGSMLDYDILLEYPDKGTIAITWCPDDGMPWSINYADHWASNFVFTINSEGATASVTVQSALLFLKTVAEKQPDLMKRIVEQKLIAMAAEVDPPQVSQEELQDAVDSFRASNGLLTAESTRNWLNEWGISETNFQQTIIEAIQRRKLRDRITAGKVEPFFDAHRAQFDRARCLQVTSPSKALVERIALHARNAGLATVVGAFVDDTDAEGVEIALASHLIRDLPYPLAVASPGILIGPFEHEGKWRLGQIIGKCPARLDEETLKAVQQELFQCWLKEKRDGAKVEWHWL